MQVFRVQKYGQFWAFQPNILVFRRGDNRKLTWLESGPNKNEVFGDIYRPLGNLFIGIRGKGRQSVRTKKTTASSPGGFGMGCIICFPTSAPSAVHPNGYPLTVMTTRAPVVLKTGHNGKTLMLSTLKKIFSEIYNW